MSASHIANSKEELHGRESVHSAKDSDAGEEEEGKEGEEEETEGHEEEEFDKEDVVEEPDEPVDIEAVAQEDEHMFV